jgi:hypothetical protein
MPRSNLTTDQLHEAAHREFALARDALLAHVQACEAAYQREGGARGIAQGCDRAAVAREVWVISCNRFLMFCKATSDSLTREANHGVQRVV